MAAAIAEAEPVTMGVSAAQFDHARALLPPAVRVVELSSDDAWMRDVGPTFVVDGRGGRRGVDWKFNAWGGLEGGLYFPWDRDDRRRAQGPRDRARRPLPRAAGARGRGDPRRRRGHLPRHRGVPAQPQPQPAAAPRRDRARPASTTSASSGSSGWARRAQRRDRRPRRQPLLLRGARRGRADLDRRPARSPVRDLARRAPAPGGGDRRARPPAGGAPAAPARAALHDRRGGPRASTASTGPCRARPATAWRPPTSTSTSPRTAWCSPLLDERFDDAAAQSLAALPRTGASSACPRARSCSAAATSTASRNRSPVRLPYWTPNARGRSSVG